MTKGKRHTNKMGAFGQHITKEAGSLYEEGMVYSNLGMSYSSAGMYQKAYDCLRKAWSLGVRNATVQKEFAWLKRNAGIG